MLYFCIKFTRQHVTENSWLEENRLNVFLNHRTTQTTMLYFCIKFPDCTFTKISWLEKTAQMFLMTGNECFYINVLLITEEILTLYLQTVVVVLTWNLVAWRVGAWCTLCWCGNWRWYTHNELRRIFTTIVNLWILRPRSSPRHPNETRML